MKGKAFTEQALIHLLSEMTSRLITLCGKIYRKRSGRESECHHKWQDQNII